MEQETASSRFLKSLMASPEDEGLDKDERRLKKLRADIKRLSDEAAEIEEYIAKTTPEERAAAHQKAQKAIDDDPLSSMGDFFRALDKERAEKKKARRRELYAQKKAAT